MESQSVFAGFCLPGTVFCIIIKIWLKHIKFVLYPHIFYEFPGNSRFY
uniref:Uncharacterized protein n=1 Tax=uncultured bacterium contig00039 TaxID=1181527 RepID=A0A806KGP4_9BACT|nr:hypothetical protein [uncultured bacterium contig00039]